MAEQAHGPVRARPTCILADDHTTLRSSLASLLKEEGFAVIGEAETASDAVALVASLHPHFAVLDYHLPDGTGIDAAFEATQLSPATRIVLYTGEAPPLAVREALAAGVRAVVRKDVPPTRLLEAIAAVLAGELYVDPTF